MTHYSTPTQQEIIDGLTEENERLRRAVEHLADEMDVWHRSAKELEAENERLSQLLWGARCVYCGEVVGKERKNQEIGDADLRAHVEVCPNHPATKLKARIEAALALHTEGDNELCRECASPWDDGCTSPTVNALRGE